MVNSSEIGHRFRAGYKLIISLVCPEPGGRVLIGCRRKGREIRIDVYDTGTGIPEDQLRQIFESFTRLAPERSDGLGIGLSIVRRALVVLGQRIEVRSVVGKGVTFLNLRARRSGKCKLRPQFDLSEGRPGRVILSDLYIG